MNYLLVHKVCNHLGSCFADDLVVSLISFLELSKSSVDDKLNNFWQLGIDCCQ